MIKAADLAEVVFAAGSVFNGLGTNRRDTLNFLATGSTRGVTSVADLALLTDLHDVVDHVVSHVGSPVDADYLLGVVSLLTRTGPIDRRLRVDEDRIGVDTRYGRHEPPALTHQQLDALIHDALSRDDDHMDRAAHLFITVAAAQPFPDGNKRTALFAAEGYLLHVGSDQLLSLPTHDIPNGGELVEKFNDLLSRAYMFGEVDALTTVLRQYTRPLPTGQETAQSQIIQ